MDKYPVKRVVAVALLLGLYSCGQKFGQKESHVVQSSSPSQGGEAVVMTPTLVAVNANASEEMNDTLLPSQRNYFILRGDYLFWEANEEGLNYGISANKETSNITTGKVKDVGGKWSSGFRVGLGYQREDDWNLKATWTYFHNHSKHSTHLSNAALITTSSSTGDVFYPSWTPNLMRVALGGTSSWTLKYNTVDLGYGRAYCRDKAVSLHLHAGLRGADIKQDLHTTYNTLDIGVAETTSTFKGINNFMGLGLRAGTDLFWNWSHHWGLFGKLSAALVYGEFKVHETAEAAAGDGDASAATIRMRHNFQALQPNLEATLGLWWKTDFCKGKQHVAIGVGYEVVEWFNQNQFFTINSDTTDSPNSFTETSRNGNLNIQGVNVSFRYAF